MSVIMESCYFNQDWWLFCFHLVCLSVCGITQKVVHESSLNFLEWVGCRTITLLIRFRRWSEWWCVYRNFRGFLPLKDGGSCKNVVFKYINKDKHGQGFVAEWVGYWTCNQRVASSNPGLPAVECSPGQVVNMCASVSRQYNLVPKNGQWCFGLGR